MLQWFSQASWEVEGGEVKRGFDPFLISKGVGFNLCLGHWWIRGVGWWIGIVWFGFDFD